MFEANTHNPRSVENMNGMNSEYTSSWVTRRLRTKLCWFFFCCGIIAMKPHNTHNLKIYQAIEWNVFPHTFTAESYYFRKKLKIHAVSSIEIGQLIVHFNENQRKSVYYLFCAFNFSRIRGVCSYIFNFKFFLLSRPENIVDRDMMSSHHFQKNIQKIYSSICTD